MTGYLKVYYYYSKIALSLLYLVEYYKGLMTVFFLA